MKNFFDELKWRGMIHDVTPGTEEELAKGPMSAYVGIDPTGDSLHIGHLVSIMILKHFQACGNKPFALVGGATGMIGDPSMKSQERNLLDEETLAHNVACIKAQLGRFLDFESDAPNKAELVNNYDWMKDYTFINFTRDIGKLITVNYMMSKDSVKKRLSRDSSEGMSFTEFTYQLLQGYDFLYLYQHKNVKLQLGGADQWGNITTGTELIRRTCGGEAYALTCPLITKAGAAVDAMIDQLIPELEPGDIIIDGGNSHFPDTIRRTQYVESKGLLYVGTGVSGGEEGALKGPSMMPGGSPAAWPFVKPIFQGICAKVENGQACCDWVGENGAGHFVKMVHNGIEYGDMQLICESYQLMRDLLGMSDDEMHEVFKTWNTTERDSYLIEITRDILAYKDTDGSPIVEKIRDTAGHAAGEPPGIIDGPLRAPSSPPETPVPM